MIKFFRKIRQNLLSQGKTGMYLKYAIGEIILVVIGILIALQINNWNEQRNESKEERLILLNLKEDFVYNQRILDSLVGRHIEIKELQISILNYTGKKPKPVTENEFNIILETLYHMGEFYPKKGALNDLINSGRLKIIKNQRLRNSLSSWPPVVERIKKREENIRQGMNGIQILIEENGSWLNVDNVSNSLTITSNAFPESGFDVDNRDLLNDLKFENKVESEIVQMNILIRVQKEALKSLTEILDLIEKEIKTNDN
ncbi:DUF6090 family protein [Muriicola soli]|uniref:Uncharacterized protein n=1 Tax=Muriicola soli TaxID=2507538 RepID=A0A411E8W6_9FLAO|nr:DUF6090 family protein [Muriicola soli]QBA63974.1 hypothetical protein EQY75_05130 [Muriicola soli]